MHDFSASDRDLIRRWQQITDLYANQYSGLHDWLGKKPGCLPIAIKHCMVRATCHDH
jgi:hypothetical protein